MENNQTDRIITVSVENEMKKSYISYAMSVIVARALPDVRDGLKPVHRRILYAMNELNLDPSKGHKKSMRIVGDTMGKYHPHGNTSIYDAMVRMAQDFSMRYMLVDGHGNFGSIDGDSPAAERYTEARLSRISMEMIGDIEKDTVDFIPNYDEEFKEPTVLPARFPNLLVNGSSGIAVGMATNIPPHNLRETIDAVIKIIDNQANEGRETDIEELIDIIKAPDFPTGASVLGTYGIKTAYRTGKGKATIRGTANIEPLGNNREMILITELPYQVNKANLVQRIGELVNEKKIEGISDIRDESNREGIRVVIELKRDANANVILNQLYKYSQLQVSFGINMLALVKNVPKVLNLKEMLVYYLEHQKEVITRRTIFDLNKAEKRAHILEGFIKALDNIDEVLNIMRSSKDTSTARASLSERFGFTDEQSAAIVELRFRSLTGMEREKLSNEYAELKELIKGLTAILNDEKLLYSLIREELMIMRTKYGDERRTQILHDPGELLIEDLIDEENSVITLSHLDYIKRVPLNTYKSQRRGGKGIIGLQMRDEDLVKNLFIANTHDYLLFFTNQGRAFRKKAYEIPESSRTSRGLAIVNLLNLNANEKIAAVIPVRKFDSDYLVLLTRNGVVKKSSLSLFDNIKNNGIIAIKFREDDELIAVLRTDGDKELFVATHNGYGLRFHESEIRSMGRSAVGVRAIRLRKDDKVVSADMLEPDCKMLFVSEKGYGKCTPMDVFTSKHRGGMGLKIYRITEKTGNVVGVIRVNDREEVMLINSEGIVIRIKISDISNQGRITQGVKLINLAQDETVVSMAKITEAQIQEELDDMDEVEDINEIELEESNPEDQ